MYRSHLDAHGRSIEELTGEHPHHGKLMYIENQRVQIIDDTADAFRRRRNTPFGKPRAVSFHGDNWPPAHMSGNYASDWYMPRDQQAVGQHVIYSAAKKTQEQRSYQPQMQERQSTRPMGRHGRRPVSDSFELVGGGFRPPGSNRAADMFKRMREHTDQFAIDETCVGPQSLEAARAGDFEGVPTPHTKQRPRQAAGGYVDTGFEPTYQPTPAPAPAPAPATRRAPAAKPTPARSQPSAQQYRPAPAQTPPTQPRPMQPKSVNPPTPRGQTQVDARQRQPQRNQQQQTSIGCKWNKETTVKRFHSNVEPYKENYNRKPQGWESMYKETYSSDDDSYDPYDIRKVDYGPAPKLELTRGFNSKKNTTYGDYNARTKGWNPIGIEEEDAEGLYNPNRPKMSSLAAAFEEPIPRRGGQRQAPQQRMSSARPYAGTEGWGAMESEDL